MAVSRVDLKSNWTFKQGGRDSQEPYLPANDLPSEVHLDLLKNKKIADPFLDLNEFSVRWVADETWTYRTGFPTPSEYGNKGSTTILRFEGLDTFASVYLNGENVLEAENMFVEHIVDVTGKLKEKDGDENTLEIVFASARQKGLELVKEHKEHRFIVHQTEISRGPVRKAQYHWGWDWGPILLTAGPWKPIVLETFTSKIVDVWVEYDIDDTLKQVEGTVFVELQGNGSLSGVISKDGTDLETLVDWKASDKKENVFTAPFELPDAALWWPHGYGAQALHTFTVHLHSSSSSALISTRTTTTGFRKVQLVREPDTHGTSFYLRLNNTDIFCGGSCWIPSDSFLTRTTPSTYDSWIALALSGNQLLLRIWGGGIYESTALLSAADRAGLLIWHDFAFACASYPTHPSYLASITTEARQNIRRLRDHASLVLWAGNNEDYQLVERYALTYDPDDHDPASWLKTDFPARYIYEHLLPSILAEETHGQAVYHPSSPFGDGRSTVLKVDPSIGDVHQWNVWHGTMEPYQRLPSLGGRFVSEFGMAAFPHVSTLARVVSDPAELRPGSTTLDARNKAIGHARRLLAYVGENFALRADMAGFTHLTQLAQADALTWAYRAWRRDWRTQGDRKCGGVLVWQLNDCWPTSSWAVVDYFGVPKPAFYAVKRALAPLAVGVVRHVEDWTVRPKDELWQRDTAHVDYRRCWGGEGVVFDVWVANSKVEGASGNVSVRFVSVRTGKEVRERIERAVWIEGNATTEVLVAEKVDVPGFRGEDEPFVVGEVDPFVIHAELEVLGKAGVSSDVSWPEPIKYLSFPDRGVKVVVGGDGSTVRVEAEKPVKGFVFEEREGVRLSDNGFDVVPGEVREVHVTGCRADELRWRYVEML